MQAAKNAILEWAKALTPVVAGLVIYYGANLTEPLKFRLTLVETNQQNHRKTLTEVERHIATDDLRHTMLLQEVLSLKETVKELEKARSAHEVHHANSVSHKPAP